MSIERAIHTRWASEPGLAALVDAERLFTGAAHGDPALPFVVLTRKTNTPLARTSSGKVIDEAVVEFNVWTADLDQGKRIAAEIGRSFDRAAFPLAEGVCLQMRRAADAEQFDPDGSWRVALEYVLIHQHSTGG